MDEKIGVEDFSNYECEIKKERGYCRFCKKVTEHEIIYPVKLGRTIEERESGKEEGKATCQECFMTVDIDDFQEE